MRMSRFEYLAGVAVAACICVVGAPAQAQTLREFDIPAGALRDGLNRYAAQSDQQILASADLVAGVRTEGVRGRLTPAAALDRLMAGTGLTWSETRPGVIVVRARQSAEISQEADEVAEVVVTGSLLRAAGVVASPVVRLDRDALDRRGLGTVAEALTSLPQNYAGSATPVVQALNSDLGASNNVYATGINLRGLGPAATLTLINGRRLAGTGSRAEFADISALPSAAVQRVDVLLDGASALYGADAIAGVVNVVMRSAFDGQESRFRMSAAQGGAEDLIVSHLAGRRWSSGSAYLAYEHQTSNALSALDRPFTADGDLRPFGGTDRRTFYSAPGNIVAFNAATASYVVQYGLRPNAGGTVQGPGDFAAGAANLQSTNLGVDLLPEVRRHSVYGRLTQAFGERFEMSADVRYNRRDNDLASAANAGVFTVSRANPFFVSPTGAASHTIAYAFTRDLGVARTHARSESLGMTLGGRYEMGAGWSAEAYISAATEEADFGNENRVNSRFLAEALGNIADDPATAYRASTDGYFNLFGSGSANSRAVLDFISQGYARSRNRSRATSTNILFQGPILTLPGGDLQLAIGAQARDESFETSGETLLSAATPLLFVTPKRERAMSSVFAEVRAPLVGPNNARPGLHRLDLSLAARVEEYSDFGTTRNPKLGVVWSPIDALNLRASWGTSFRAGALPQLFDQAGASATFLNRSDGARVLSLFLNGGNPSLKPETSETVTLGFDLRRKDGMAFSFNYFDTRFDDRIARPVNENAAGALNDPALSSFVRLVNPGRSPADLALIESYAALPGFSTLYPTNTYGAIVDSRWVNTGAVQVRGIDLSGRYGWDLGGGKLTLDASASWILDYDTRSTPTAPVRAVEGLIGYPVELRARSGVVWSRNAVDLGLHWAHVGAYEDRLGAGIDAWNTLDMRVNWSPEAGVWSGTRLSLGVDNLLDEAPPFYDGPTGYGFDAGQASLLGRTVSLQLIRRW